MGDKFIFKPISEEEKRVVTFTKLIKSGIFNAVSLFTGKEVMVLSNTKVLKEDVWDENAKRKERILHYPKLQRE